MHKKRFFPFAILPGSWGLKGKAFDEAEAYYYYDGEDLERRLAEIRNSDNTMQLALVLNDINYKYHHITEYDHSMKIADITIKDTKQRALKQVDIDEQFGKLAAYEADIKRIDLNFPEPI